jgi:hypothetical protein
VNLKSRIVSLLKRHGILNTSKKILEYQFSVFYRKIKEKEIFKHDSIEGRFTAIYRSNYWGSKESVSGSGSTLLYTENLRNKLPYLLQKYSIKSVFDAPCGDFNWMHLLLEKINVIYIGGDIVKDLINSHNLNYKNNNTNFIHIDLTQDKFPHADLMICRDCLFHLSYQDTKLVLNNFINSGITYLLTTTHKNIIGFQNKDISTGLFRTIDLFSTPYLFESNPFVRIDDWMYPEPERELCLWHRDQIITTLNSWKT